MKYILHYIHFTFLNLPIIMSWLKYYFFAFITHHQPVTVNLVHFIIISALVCSLYYQLQYSSYRILDIFMLRLSKCRKVKTFLRNIFLVWLIWRGSYSKWSCSADPLNNWSKASTYECICDFLLLDCHCLYFPLKIWPRGCLTPYNLTNNYKLHFKELLMWETWNNEMCSCPSYIFKHWF